LIQPAPVVVVAPPPVVVPIARPRIAVLNFVVDAAPGLVPPAFGDWAAEQIASYFAPSYEVIERGEVCWYMGRLGVTMRDVLMNPSARICLGRALNVRFFVFGAIQQTASFDVSTHLIDAESGAKQGVGKIHVQDHQELKLRAGELVQQVQANPADANRLQQEAKEKEKVLNEARKLFTAGQYPQTVSFCQEGLKRFPDHVGLQTLKQQAEQALQQAMQEQKRQQDFAAQQAQAAALQKRQQELAQEAETARKRAETAAAARTEAQRQAQDAQKQKAGDELYTAGHRALQQGNYTQAVQMLQSSVALKPTDVAVRELAQARAKVDEQAQSQAAQEKARQEIEAKRQKDAELARARAQVEEARQKHDAEELARRKAQAAALAEKSKKAEEQQRLAEFQRLMKEGNAALAARQFDSAVKTFTQASKVLPGSVEAQTALSRAEQARDQNLALIRQQEEADKAAKAAAAKKAADDAARAAATKKAADDAARAAAAKKAADDAARAATAKKVADDAAKAAQVKQLLSAGRTALNARQFDAAAKAFTEAGKLAPGDPELAKALQDLDQARRAAAVADAELKKRMEIDTKNRQAAYQAAMNAGRQALTAKQFDDAVRSVTEAGRLQPGDPAAAALLKDVDKTRKAEYARLMPLGKAAMTAKKFEEAVKTFTDALRAQPGDPAATAALKEAQQALQGSKSPPKK
jgi:tetratricopeptide (TPR) repeat protein